MNFEFMGTSDMERARRKPEKCGEKIRVLRSTRTKSKTKKERCKYGKRIKEQHRAIKEQRRTIEELSASIDAMQAEIYDLKNYDKDGFLILRRRRNGL